MSTMKITCDTCNTTHTVDRTPEIPSHVVSMGCNWCPKCEDKADDYYEEWYNESDDDSLKGDDVPPNQLCLGFVWNEIFTEESQEKIEV
ncbi:MAG: hypothetical protein ABJG41_01425 [Cyclobacteriaceae bacterium]